MRVGVFDHFGWAVAVTASGPPDHAVVDRRRIELVEPGLSEAPIHYDRGRSTDAACAELVAAVRASSARLVAAALADLAAVLPAAVTSISLRTWPPDFPTDIAVLRRPPYEARADAVRYRQVLAEVAEARGWDVHRYDATSVVARATEALGDRASEVLDAPRATLGPPWTKDHKIALAATIVAAPGAAAS